MLSKDKTVLFTSVTGANWLVPGGKDTSVEHILSFSCSPYILVLIEASQECFAKMQPESTVDHRRLPPILGFMWFWFFFYDSAIINICMFPRHQPFCFLSSKDGHLFHNVCNDFCVWCTTQANGSREKLNKHSISLLYSRVKPWPLVLCLPVLANYPQTPIKTKCLAKVVHFLLLLVVIVLWGFCLFVLFCFCFLFF